MGSDLKAAIVSLVVCDNIYREPDGKFALVGLFNQLMAHGFPVIHPKLAVFVSLTDIPPNSNCTLEIHHGESGAKVV